MRPPGYEPGELPTAPPRDVMLCNIKEFLFFNCGCKVSAFFGHCKTKREFFVEKVVRVQFFSFLCKRNAT